MGKNATTPRDAREQSRPGADAFISLDGGADAQETPSASKGTEAPEGSSAPGAGAPLPGHAPSRAKVAGAAVGAVLCLALALVSLGFVYPAQDGSWSLAWLFQTTEEAADVSAQGSVAPTASEDDADDGPADDAAADDGSATAGEADAAASSATGADDGAASVGSQGAPSGGASDAGGSGSSSADASQDAGTSGGASSDAGEQQPATVTISVSVSSSEVGGPVSASGSFTFEEGATAYDALCALNLSVNAQSSAYGIYVTAIGGLAQFDHGSNSGWMYSVNGASPNTSASSYVLRDGDSVSWYYVV